MIPDVKEAEEEGKQKAKQVNDDLEVFEHTVKAINSHSIVEHLNISLLMLCFRTKLVQRGWIYFSLFSFQYFLQFSMLSTGLSSCSGVITSHSYNIDSYQHYRAGAMQD